MSSRRRWLALLAAVAFGLAALPRPEPRWARVGLVPAFVFGATRAPSDGRRPFEVPSEPRARARRWPPEEAPAERRDSRHARRERPGPRSRPEPARPREVEPSRPAEPAPRTEPEDRWEPPSALEVGDRRWAAWRGLRPGPGAPTTPPPGPSAGDASHVLRAPMDARDAELGLHLPAAGNIATALSTSVRAHTPPRSVATFVATIDAGGRVRAIAVRSYSAGEPAAWEDAAQAARKSLSANRFRLRSDMPHGALVSVRVFQNVELPSGAHRKGDDKRRLPRQDRHPKRAPGKPEAPSRPSWRVEGYGVAALPPDIRKFGNPEAMVPPCEPDRALPQACFNGLFDLSDAGAHAQRVVKAITAVRPRPPPAESREGQRQPDG